MNNEISNLENEDLKIENAELKINLEKLAAEKEIQLNNNRYLREELDRLKSWDMRLSSIDLYRKYRELLKSIQDSYSKEMSEITVFENKMKAKFENAKKNFYTNYIGKNDKIFQDFLEYENRILKEIVDLKAERAERAAAGKAELKKEYKELKSETSPIKQMGDSNFEKFIGLNVMNKVGAAFIVLAVIMGSVYAYSNFLVSPSARCFFIFLFGFVLSALGEFLNRRKRNVFSIGLVSGGIAILYIGVFVTYYYSAEIFKNTMTFVPVIHILFALLTVGVFVLSLYYNSRTISIFGIIGGYLSAVFIFQNADGRFFSVSTFYLYFIMMNLLILFISVKRDWNIIHCFGLSFNFIIYAIFAQGEQPNYFNISALYFGFIINLFSTLLSVKKAKKLNFILIFLNILISSFYVYQFLAPLEKSEITIISFLIFVVLIFIFSKIFEKKLADESRIISFLDLTALTYLFLCIPIKFGFGIFPFVFMLESTLVYLWGIIKKDRIYKILGFTAFSAFSVLFLLGSFSDFIYYTDAFYNLFRYGVFSLCFIAIIAGYKNTGEKLGTKEKILKYSGLIITYFYTEFSLNFLLNYFLSERLNTFIFHLLVYIININLPFIFYFGILKINYIKDEITENFCKILFYFAMFKSLLVMFRGGLYSTTANVFLILTVILMTVCIIYYLIKFINRNYYGKIDILSAAAVTAFIFLNKLMFMEFSLDGNSFIVSLAYIISSVILVISGFIKNNKFLRRFGLLLSIFGIVKIFVFDFTLSTTESKIFSYFLLGLCLLFISFLYQYFSKKIDDKGGK